MNSSDQIYQDILQEAQNNPQILGVVLCGSRGKDDVFLTPHSDYDVVVVISDDAPQLLKEKIKSFENPKFEVWAKTLTEFKEHARWGTEHDWDRYNYTHNKAIIDKIGEIQKIVEEKGSLPKEVQRDFLEGNLDCYVNSLYRSAKYWRDGNELSALIDASESLPYLMDSLYALEGRVKPYNKYFEWELRNHPLKFLPWLVDEFITDYKTILTTGDIKIQEKIWKGVKKLFIEQGYSKSIDGWKGKYFVG